MEEHNIDFKPSVAKLKRKRAIKVNYIESDDDDDFLFEDEDASLQKKVKLENKTAINKKDVKKTPTKIQDKPAKKPKKETDDDYDADEGASPKKKVKLENKTKTVKKEVKKKTPTKKPDKTVKKLKSETVDDCDGAVSSKTKVKDESAIKLESKPEIKHQVKVGVGGGGDGVVSWNAPEVIAAKVEVPSSAARNVVRLLDEGCTIPFIARYRKEQTGDMEVQKLRDVLNVLEDLRAVESKVKSVKAAVKTQGKLTKELEKAFSNAQTLTEVECLFAPFKPGQKGSLAERAKALGLEPLALKFVAGSCEESNVTQAINPDEKGLQTRDKVVEGVKHIIADMIHKDTDVMEKIRTLSTNPHILIQSKKVKESKTKENEQKKLKPGVKQQSAHKFEGYFDKTVPVKYIQSHMILAINRGESNKILSVKVLLPEFVQRELERVCRSRWLKHNMSPFCRQMIESSIQDAYSRMMEPQISRLVRSQLTKEAEKASIEVFAGNLKCLLLTAPLKGSTILAVDPGFTNGCKTAVISKTGEILATAIVYMHSNKSNFERNKLNNLIETHGCEVVAIGNGVACRETEAYVSKLIQEFFPKLKYCIISESGASIYSVSDAAQAEMPELDPSLRGAVSIGRRLLDPLAEYVKVDPKHLGIGQYQLDMPQNQLKSTLDSTIEECVSFVGVDVNTCSQCLLSHVSGLSAAKAKKIIEFRNQFGPFLCREQLKSVKGLGEKTYEQAAGFIRIHRDLKAAPTVSVKPEDVKPKPAKAKGRTQRKTSAEFEPNPLDMTWIHPESYDITHRLLDKIPVDVSSIGQHEFIRIVNAYLSNHSMEEIAECLGCGVPTVKLITDALKRHLAYDFRDEFEKPLFRSKVKSMAELKRFDVVTGRVMNVTNFGAFVDIGVGTDALIHVSKMVLETNKQKVDLKLGDKVEGRIINIEIDRKRIAMQLMKVL